MNAIRVETRRLARGSASGPGASQRLVGRRGHSRSSAATLGDLDGRDLPTVRAAAQRILALGGKLDAKTELLVVSLPEELAPDSADHDRLHAELMDCVRVLVAVEALVISALSSRSKQPLAERLPDSQVAAAGGLA